MTAGEDRFGDLGPGGEGESPPAKSAAERFEELDRREAAEAAAKGEGRDDPPRPSGRYSWVVGVAFFIVIVIGLVRLLQSDSGAPGPAADRPLPDFAAPLAGGGLNGDVNLKRRVDESGEAGGKPACQVRGKDVVNICALRRRPVVLAFGGEDCAGQLDRLERVSARFPGVNFVGILIKEDRSGAERISRKGRRWTYPVAFDRDGQLSSPAVYDVRACPTTVFAYAGGNVRKTVSHEIDEGELRAETGALIRGPAAGGRR